jgi:non-lysosomal glucosylceramidase
MFTWENAVSPTQPKIDGTHSLVDPPSTNRLLLELQQERSEAASPVSFGMGVEGTEETEITSCLHFDTESKGRELWQSFKKDGILAESIPKPSKRSHKEGGALCAKVQLEPKESAEITFALSWDIPIIQFGNGRRWYKYYTRFFGANGRYAIPLVTEALDNWRIWMDKIEEWQRPVLESDRPIWLKSGLFNELYFLVDSSSSWIIGEVWIFRVF